ncbi:MAG: hypothetical protein P1U39_00530 [Legionellaceae bacterium]|nr:hypothetical protein [Legionellaceae bacterium]
MKHCKKKAWSCLIWLVSCCIYADVPTASPHFVPANSAEAHWVFSGVVEGEGGEQYGYFFQMDRHKHIFHSRAALFDVQTKAVLIQDDSEAEIADPSTNIWHVGHAFLRFNPITDSWFFGFKQANKAGFNFKVDMQKPLEALPESQNLRSGISVFVSQTNSLNGHVNAINGQKEHFVTARQAWFRQTSVTTPQSNTHAVKGVLCRFDDGSGFYSVNLPEEDALRGAIAGRFDAQGVAEPMSQFIHVGVREDGKWGVHVPSPEQNVLVSAFMQQDAVIAGVAEVEDQAGFCFLSEDTLGHQDETKTV